VEERVVPVYYGCGGLEGGGTAAVVSAAAVEGSLTGICGESGVQGGAAA
jgi:hypothetical protein